MRTTATLVSLCALGLALAACQPREKAAAPTATPAAPATPAVPAGPAAGATPAADAAADAAAAAIPPETVLAVNQALAAASAFNAKTAEDLAAVAKAQKRIHDLAVQAAADAQRGGAGENERLALGRKVANARTEAEAAHADLVSRQTAFRTVAQSQTDAVAAALLQCAGSPEFAASEPCVKLQAEQATLTQSTAALTKGFTAAEAAYQKDRVKLDEASATMALGVR